MNQTNKPASTDMPAGAHMPDHPPAKCGQEHAQPVTIQADSLFKSAQEVLIQHKGDLYHLRITRNDKLILTK
jgi:hemin uptake protein HemP